MVKTRTADVIVAGAGVFGTWTAWHLHRKGYKTLIVDAYGPANSRASSGGESRIIRCSYGSDEIYSLWAQRSLMKWKQLQKRSNQKLFHQTGVLWMRRRGQPFLSQTLETLAKLGVKHENLSSGELRKRYPQMRIERDLMAIFEPEAGALMARRAVQTLFHEMIAEGVGFLSDTIMPINPKNLAEIKTKNGIRLRADKYVIACGPWIDKVTPDVLGGRVYPTRQEVYFFGIGSGDTRFMSPQFPIWTDEDNEYYGMPDLESRGLKIARHVCGPRLDPDTAQRNVTPKMLAMARKYLARRFPDLKNAPLLESRVCQYENTSTKDFIIDRYPGRENIWLVGGGSGHGYKHGPALGEYVASKVIDGGDVELRFSLATKAKVTRRML